VTSPVTELLAVAAGGLTLAQVLRLPRCPKCRRPACGTWGAVAGGPAPGRIVAILCDLPFGCGYRVTLRVGP
jgi:hypothetical protein